MGMERCVKFAAWCCDGRGTQSTHMSFVMMWTFPMRELFDAITCSLCYALDMHAVGHMPHMRLCIICRGGSARQLLSHVRIRSEKLS